MKKLAVIAIALFTLNGMAQAKQNGSKDRKEKRELRKDLTPQDIASLKSKKLTLQLDLSDKQQKKVYNIILKQAEDHQKLRKERIANRSEDSKPTKEELVAFQNKRLEKQIELKREMKAILSAEQYAKFEKMKPRKGRKRGRKHKKRN